MFQAIASCDKRTFRLTKSRAIIVTCGVSATCFGYNALSTDRESRAMAGILSYLIPIVALAVLGAMPVGLRRCPPSVEDNPGHCSSCATPMSLRRVPSRKSHAFLGEWVCPHCRNRFKSGKGVSGTA
jgi:hypothetical protein